MTGLYPVLTALLVSSANPVDVLRDNGRVALDPEEVAALWKLVDLRDGDAAGRHLRDALEAVRVGTRIPRAAEALHAAVGLDRKRRDGLEAWLLERVRDEASPLMRRVRRALVLLELGEPTPAVAAAVAPVLAREVAETYPAYWTQEAVEALLRLRSHLPADRWRAVCLTAVEGLVAKLDAAEDHGDAGERVRHLVALSAHLDGGSAERLHRQSFEQTEAAALRLKQKGKEHDLHGLLCHLLDQLRDGSAALHARRLLPWALDPFDNPAPGSSPRERVFALLALSRHLTDDEVAALGARVQPRLTVALVKEALELRLGPWETERLPALTARWRPEDARALCLEVVTYLVGALAAEPYHHNGREALPTLIRLIAALPAEVAEPAQLVAVNRFDRAFRAAKDAEVQALFASRLAALVDARPTARGEAACRACAAELARRLRAARIAGQLHPLAARVAQPLSRVSPSTANALVVAAQTRYDVPRAWQLSVFLAAGYASVARHAPPEETLELLLPPVATRGHLHLTEAHSVHLARALVAALDRLDPGEQARYEYRVAEALARLVTEEGDFEPHTAEVLHHLAGALRRLPPGLAERLGGRLLGWAGRRAETDARPLAGVVPFVRPFVAPKEIEREAVGAARRLHRAIGEAGPDRQRGLGLPAALLADLAGSLPPDLAARWCAEASRRLADFAPEREADLADEARFSATARLLDFVPPADADLIRDRVARSALERAWSKAIRVPFDRPTVLPLLYPPGRDARVREIATLVAQGPTATLAAPVWLPKASQPLPEPPSAELCVELLKHPLCVGDDRRAVLGALGVRYGRTFLDQWDFVRFAEEGKLGLDLASPPKRDR